MICLWNKVDFHSRPEAEAFDAMICFEEADLIHAERLGLTERGDDEKSHLYRVYIILYSLFGITWYKIRFKLVYIF